MAPTGGHTDDDAHFEALAARKLGEVSNPKAGARRPTAVYDVFGLPHDRKAAEELLFPPDIAPIGPVAAQLRNPSLGIYAGYALEQGKRSYMEDRVRCLPDVLSGVSGLPSHITPACFFGVFDGHGESPEVAEYLMNHLADRLYKALLPSFDRYQRMLAGEDVGQVGTPTDAVAIMSTPSFREPLGA